MHKAIFRPIGLLHKGEDFGPKNTNLGMEGCKNCSLLYLLLGMPGMPNKTLNQTSKPHFILST